MTMPPVPPGFTRYVMKSAFGMGRDFRILDPATEEQLFLVDGKVGPRPRAEVTDAAGTVLFDVRGRLIGIPKRMDVTAGDGTAVAHLHGKPFRFVHDEIEVTLADGHEWLLRGNVIEKDYLLADAAGQTKVQITQKWLTVRDRYTLDVADGVEPGLAFALTWAIDRWVERD